MISIARYIYIGSNVPHIYIIHNPITIGMQYYGEAGVSSKPRPKYPVILYFL